VAIQLCFCSFYQKLRPFPLIFRNVLQAEDHRRKWDKQEYEQLANERLREEFDKTDSKHLLCNRELQLL